MFTTSLFCTTYQSYADGLLFCYTWLNHCCIVVFNLFVALQRLADTLYREIPVGVGSHKSEKFSINSQNLESMLNHGMKFLVQNNIIWPEDIEHVEEHGSMPGADAKFVSTRAKQRGNKWETCAKPVHLYFVLAHCNSHTSVCLHTCLFVV